MTKISIVIPTYNEEGFIGRLLESISQQMVAPYEVIVVDSGSDDATAKEVAQFADKLPLVGICAARGVSKQRNAGALIANGDVILFLDSDVELQPNFLCDAMQEFTERNLDLAGGHFYIDPELSTFDRFGAKVIDVYHASFQFSRNPMGSGFCLFVAKKWHKRIGGFNEDFQHSEDHDYVKRAVEHGAVFRLLKAVRFKLSNRRYVQDGRFAVVSLYAKAELNRIFFNYKFAPREKALYNFGIFTKEKKRRSA